jgi:hypothetical protein
MGTTLRALILTVGGLLALPQGWCCFVLALAAAPCRRTPDARPVPTKTEAPPCCREASRPRPVEMPAEPPAPEPPLCCCDDLSWDRPPQPLVATADLAAADLPPDLVLPEAPRPALTVAPPPAVSPPVRLLHCVWLC